MAGLRASSTPVPAPPPGTLTCAEVRGYLSALAHGTTPPPQRGIWDSLSPRSALTGSLEHPQLTAVGQQVLRELELRAYRVDAMPLDTMVAQVSDAISQLKTTAEATEYFVGELGPVPPVGVLHLLRIVATNLASRPEPPEDLVETFKNAWGSMEVLGGNDEDRLFAAELVVASGFAQESFYSPMMLTVDRLRAQGCRSALSTATLLHLYPSVTSSPSIDRWATARHEVGRDEEAALLAQGPDLAWTLGAYRSWVDKLEGSPLDRQRAATYLTVNGPPYADLDRRVRETSGALKSSFDQPLLAAAVLASHLPFRPTELVDWLTKATEIAASRQLAPTRPELSVVGLSLVRGLPTRGGDWPASAGSGGPGGAGGMGLAAHVALHAGLFRGLRPTSTPHRPPT